MLSKDVDVDSLVEVLMVRKSNTANAKSYIATFHFGNEEEKV